MIASVALLFLFLDISTAYSFHEEPQDTNVIDGMAVTLRCIVSNWGSMNVLWYDHGNHRYISRDRVVYNRAEGISERFSIIGDAPSGEYFLHIRNMTSEDAGLYSCLLFQDRSFRLSSRDALLQVFPKPNEGFPVCSITPDVTSGGTGPGDWIMLSCVAEGGSPFSRLDWKRSFEILPASFLDEKEPRSLYEFRLTEYHNGAVFSCVENNPVLEHTRSCSVMPFYRHTNVSVLLNPRAPIVGEEVILNCVVEALPNHGLNYTWSLNGQEISRYEEYHQVSFSNDGSQLIFQSINGSFNNSLFECNVLNVISLEGKAALQLTLLSVKVHAKVIPVKPVESRGLPVGLIVCVAAIILIVISVIVLVLAYRRKRVGILNLLKTRRSSFKFSHRYGEHERYRSARHDDVESTQPVLICATPSEAIQEHLKELSVQHSESRRPKHGPPPPPTRTVSQSCTPPPTTSTVSQTGTQSRGRSRPVISLPMSPIIPDLPVVLRDLNIKYRDTSSVDEDYVSDTDTDWDL